MVDGELLSVMILPIGLPPRDILHPDGSVEKQPLNFPSLNLAFTFAVQDLKSLWRWYRYGYEKELTE